MYVIKKLYAYCRIVTYCTVKPTYLLQRIYYKERNREQLMATFQSPELQKIVSEPSDTWTIKCKIADPIPL